MRDSGGGHERAPAVTLEALYASDYRPLVGLAILLVDDVESAEEIVQDAFLQLHHRWERVENPGGFLRRCVVNGGRDVQRRRQVRRRPIAPPAADTSSPFRELEDVLAKLPFKQRAAIVLRYCDDLAEADIAAALDVRPTTVRTLVRRGLHRLRAEVTT